MKAQEVHREITEIVGPKRITIEYIDCFFYSWNLSVDQTELPGMAVLPKTSEEVSKIVRIVGEYNIPIFTFEIYKNLDALGTYGLTQVYKLEPYEQVTKKYYMITLKGIYIVFEYLKDLNYYSSATSDKYTASRWSVEIQEKYITEYTKIVLTPELVEEEYELLKLFLQELSLSINDLNDMDIFLVFTIFTLENMQDKKLKNLELKKIESLLRIFAENKQVYKALQKQLTHLMKSSENFLKLLNKSMECKR